MEGVQAAMTTRNLEPDQWRNREEWRLVTGRQRQLLKTPDRQIMLLTLHVLPIINLPRKLRVLRCVVCRLLNAVSDITVLRMNGTCASPETS